MEKTTDTFLMVFLELEGSWKGTYRRMLQKQGVIIVKMC